MKTALRVGVCRIGLRGARGDLEPNLDAARLIEVDPDQAPRNVVGGLLAQRDRQVVDHFAFAGLNNQSGCFVRRTRGAPSYSERVRAGGQAGQPEMPSVVSRGAWSIAPSNRYVRTRFAAPKLALARRARAGGRGPLLRGPRLEPAQNLSLLGCSPRCNPG